MAGIRVDKFTGVFDTMVIVVGITLEEVAPVSYAVDLLASLCLEKVLYTTVLIVVRTEATTDLSANLLACPGNGVILVVDDTANVGANIRVTVIAVLQFEFVAATA